MGPVLNNKTYSLFEPHLNYLSNKVLSVSEQLKTFEVSRVKRGLVDGLGSIVKSITGNLDYTDALHYNQAIKDLQLTDNKLVTELNSHVSITKEWMSQYAKIVDNIADSQTKITHIINKISETEATRDYDLIKYAHLAQAFLILGDNVDSISQEVLRLQNVLGFIKMSIPHHSIISRKSFDIIFNKLRNLYSNDKIIEIDTREYYDIIKVGSYYVDNEIVIIYKFPIVFPQVYDMYKLSIVPNKYDQIIIPPYPFLAIHEKEFKYIVAECPKTSKWYICDEKRGLQTQEKQDCMQQLIISQQKTTLCKPVSVALQVPAYDELDDKHYTLSFPSPTKVHLSCGQELYQILHGSYLAVVPHSCFIETPDFVVTNTNDLLKGQVLKIMDLPLEKPVSQPTAAATIKMNSVNLNQLHTLNTKITMQQPIEVKTDTDYSVYHTTIPLYLTLISTCVLAATLAYRKYWLKKKPEGDQSGLSRIYAVPDTEKRVDANQPPASFNTKVFTRCSTGGGVMCGTAMKIA